MLDAGSLWVLRHIVSFSTDFLRPLFDWKYAMSYTNGRDGNARMFVMNEQWSLYWVSLDRCGVWAVWDRCWHYVRLLFEVWFWLLSDAHLSWVSNIVQQTCRWGNVKGVAHPKMIYVNPNLWAIIFQETHKENLERIFTAFGHSTGRSDHCCQAPKTKNIMNQVWNLYN